jgi:threonine/homoserine/homoserine lactone efflux protein
VNTQGIHDLPLFIASGLLLSIAPGPDSLLITTRSASQGWRAGSIAAFGVIAGTFVHIGAAALGLSALPCHIGTGVFPAQVGGCGLSDLHRVDAPAVATSVHAQ